MSAEPLVMIELHVRPVLAGYWVCIYEALEVLADEELGGGRYLTDSERMALEDAERAENAGDYADAQVILADMLESLEREIFEEHDLIAGAYPEQGVWVVAPVEWWEGVDA